MAYIDESGDEGFVFSDSPPKKSSEWWVISAVVVRESNHQELEDSVSTYRALYPRGKPFHFSDATHERRIGFITYLMRANVRFISIITHKPTLLSVKPEIATKKHYLFYYTAKLLIERITWLCDFFVDDDESKKAKIVISDRGQLRRAHLDNYLSILRGITATEASMGIDVGNHDIKWRRISDELIIIEPHNSLAGLQAADAVASGMRAALELTLHNQTEHRYAKMLAPKTWRRYRSLMKYGLKIEPQINSVSIPQPNRLHWLHHYE